MTEDTWNTRDLPVLQAIVDIYEDSGTYLTRATGIERRTGLDHDTVQRALRRLNSQPSFFEKVVEASGGQVIMVGPPTADALRIAGAWPSPEQLLQRLITALEVAADDDARGPEERSKFGQAAAYLGSFATRHLTRAHCQCLLKTVCVPSVALKGDSYRIKDRDLGRVPGSTTEE